MAAGPEGVPGVMEGSEPPGTLPAEPPRVRQHRGRFLVWAPEAARTLRERYRLWGALVGIPPRRRGRAGLAGPRLPLELRAEEAEAMRESGGGVVEKVDEDEDEDEEERAAGPSRPSPPLERRSRAFRALWGRGAHLTPGGKFGGDFLVYPGPPSQFHACAVALCPCPSQPQPLGALLAGARLGASVRKALLLCAAPPGGALTCTTLQWRSDLA